MDFTAIILAAGSGSRVGFDYNKVLHEIKGKIILDYSIEFFQKYPSCKEIVLVCSDHDFNFVFDRYRSVADHIIIGGETRQNSVYKGLNKAMNDIVLVHDSARPFINSACIDALCDDLESSKATTLAVPVTDTIVRKSGNRLTKTLDRNELIALQTPQGFDRHLLLEVHRKAMKSKYDATDDTDLVRRFSDVMPSYVMGDYRSMKLTTKDDIALLEVIL